MLGESFEQARLPWLLYEMILRTGRLEGFYEAIHGYYISMGREN